MLLYNSIMEELSYSQFTYLMKRFPEFELSYETISHKKVSDQYDVCLAIPIGRKCFAWFTYQEEKDVCYLLELNRDKKIIKMKIAPTTFHHSLSLGTILYGTLWEDNGRNFFVIEEIVFYEGIHMKGLLFYERLGFIRMFSEKTVQEFGKDGNNMIFGLPTSGKIGATLPTPAYPVHHHQYRSSTGILPYINEVVNKKNNMQSLSSQQTQSTSTNDSLLLNRFKMDFSKPQYRMKTVFMVMADIQYDIYNLYVYGKGSQPIYYNVAYIPSYKTSVFMNGIFRKIRENKNLDYIEESDDEEDFQNMNDTKYVDVNKKVLMECLFHKKFKKWMPIRIVDFRQKVVHFSKL